ncbi:RNA ligase family protein [Aquabacterium sp. A7-Y]|uniref:RNA ligase family protein n=1 Tax=Aquabacterium sp. A7-Y TaxID=1349605 RepID=UPI00223E8CCB|nr:RNA ligase family protein [Aquabacterium sp. A7-Y]MCW7539957.1 RNA ligase family protein [Aquabacterium sp. A7-Y]
MSIPSLSILKYPRTPHLEGSRLQPGDDSSDQVPLALLAGRHVVIEEKLDGANAAVSFSEAGEMLLQSRGHYLAGGGGERQFGLFKRWAAAHETALLERLEDRYVLYGEWLYAKHSVWYDSLPHYFCEFDIYDRRQQRFLSTPCRRKLLAGSPVLSVPVLYEGPAPSSLKALRAFVRPSLAKSLEWRDRFAANVLRHGQRLALSWQQTDRSDASEGLYLKLEDHSGVTGRYKWVRQDFVQTLLDSGSHHSQRPLLPNLLADGVDLYAPRPAVGWPLPQTVFESKT